MSDVELTTAPQQQLAATGVDADRRGRATWTQLRELEAELPGQAVRAAGLHEADDARHGPRAASQLRRGADDSAPERLEAALAERRERARRRGAVPGSTAERLDLTESLGRVRVGHAHVVTQTWERLEDVFVGMGFSVADGPEVETDWFNFEALNLPPAHPARSLWDTLYLDTARSRRGGRRRAGAADPHLAGADPHDAPCRSRPATARRSTWCAPAGCTAATPRTPRTCRCSTRSRGW